jgi:predicted DsbA family dithiol-disulfide isomerase
VSERIRVGVYYDFASSLCYVAHRVMQRLEGDLESLSLELVWTPLDLCRLTGWPRGAPIEGYRRENALRVARELEVDVRMPGHWVDSRAANGTALALAGTVHEPAWRERVFSAIHEEGRFIDAPGTLEALARDLRIDLDELYRGADSDLLAAATDRARAAEVTGVPTFMLAEWPIGGIQEPAVMRSLLGRWAAKQRRKPDE